MVQLWPNCKRSGTDASIGFSFSVIASRRGSPPWVVGGDWEGWPGDSLVLFLLLVFVGWGGWRVRLGAVGGAVEVVGGDFELWFRGFVSLFGMHVLGLSVGFCLARWLLESNALIG